MSVDSAEFGRRIAALREAKQETQADVSAAIDCSRAHIANIEVGRGNLSLERAAALAEHFGVTLDSLITPPGGGNIATPPPPAARPSQGYGARLRAFRLALELTETEFARLGGIGAPLLRRLEAERAIPGIDILMALRDAPTIGLSADWLLFGDFSALTARVVQRMINLGVRPDAPMPARELRREMRERGDAQARPRSDTLHEKPAALHQTIRQPRD